MLGALDIEHALRGEICFRPGLLAQADGGFLYIDEVNLLDDYIVDLLLDVAASGINRVERDGVSHVHPARFVLVGSGNPEEGELRPQLEDRFGLATHVSTITELPARLEIVRRRLAFDADASAFAARFAEEERLLASRVIEARERLDTVHLPEEILDRCVELCVEARAVGHRADIVLTRTARAAAAFAGRSAVTRADVAAAAVPTLRHRTPREPLERATAPAARVKLAAARVLGLRAA